MDDLNDKEKKILSLIGLNKFIDKSYLWNFALIHLLILLFTIYTKFLNYHFIKKLVYSLAEIGDENANDNKKENKLKLNESLLNNFSSSPIIPRIGNEPQLSDILIKLFIFNLDNFTLICMYMVAIKEVNFSHFSKILFKIFIVMVHVFLIQLIFPKLTKSRIIWILLILETILFFEYIWGLINPFIEITTELMKIISFMAETDTDNNIKTENLAIVILYLYYLQYQNYNNDIYKKYDNKIYNIKYYFHTKLENFPKFKTWVNKISIVLKSTYIWLILSLLFLCIFLTYINFFFLITLIIYLVIVYSYVHVKSENFIITASWTFIVYCGMNTMIVYFYQFTSLELIKPYFEIFLNHLPVVLKSNLDVLGLTIYKKEELDIKFLSHYGCNLLSVLLLYEIKRIYLLLKKDKETETKKQNIKAVSNENDEHLSKEQVSIPYSKYYFFYSLLILSKAYWLIFFYIIYILSVNYQLSIAILVYITTFLIILLIMFKKYLNEILATENKFIRDNRIMYTFLKQIKYVVSETNLHNKIHKKYKQIAFKILLIFSFIFIIITYAFAIVDYFKRNNPDIANSLEIYECFFYILGTYHNFNDSIIYSIFTHFMFSLLLIIDSYMFPLQNYLKIEVDRLNLLIKAKKKFELEKNMKCILNTSCERNVLQNIPLKLSLNSVNINFQRTESQIKNELGFSNIDRRQFSQGQETSISIRLDKLDKFKINSSKFEMIEEKDENLEKTNSNLNLPNLNKSCINFKNSATDIITEEKGLMKLNNDDLESCPKMNKSDMIKPRNSETAYAKQLKRNNNSQSHNSNEELSNTIYIISPDDNNNDSKNKIKKNSNKQILNKFLKIFEDFSKPNNNSLFSNKIKSKNVKLEYYFTLKRLLEEIIIMFILISAIVKLNFFSIFYLILMFVMQIVGKKTKTVYYLSTFLSILLLLQYLLILSNINEKTDPNHNSSINNSIERLFGIPWYKKIEYFKLNPNFGFYFGFGVVDYQLLILGFDFFTLFLCFIYLENFSYVLFQNKYETPDKNSINLFNLWNKKVIKDIFLKIKKEDFDSIRETLIYNFTAILPIYEDCIKQFKLATAVSINDFHLPTNINKKLYEFLKKHNRKTKSEKWFLAIKSSFYLIIHNLVLLSIIILSVMNESIVSVIYLLFSFFYLNSSKQILLGEKTNFPSHIKKFLVNLFFLDILIQILYQSPFLMKSIQTQNLIFFLLESIGLKYAIIEYDPFNYNKLTLNLLQIKAFMYFLCSILVLIYSSKDFKEYYSAYLFERTQNTYLHSAMNSGLFNNKRIEMMQTSIDYKNEINKVLKELETHLKKWDEKLNDYDSKDKEHINQLTKDMEKMASPNPKHKNSSSYLHDESIMINNGIPVPEPVQKEKHLNTFNISMGSLGAVYQSENPHPKNSTPNWGNYDSVNTNQNHNTYNLGNSVINVDIFCFRNCIREICMSYWLVKFAFFMNKISTGCLFVSKAEKDELETAIIKGFTHIPCRIDKKINDFVDEFNVQDFITIKLQIELEKENNKLQNNEEDKIDNSIYDLGEGEGVDENNKETENNKKYYNEKEHEDKIDKLQNISKEEQDNNSEKDYKMEYDNEFKFDYDTELKIDESFVYKKEDKVSKELNSDEIKEAKFISLELNQLITPVRNNMRGDISHLSLNQAENIENTKPNNEANNIYNYSIDYKNNINNEVTGNQINISNNDLQRSFINPILEIENNNTRLKQSIEYIKKINIFSSKIVGKFQLSSENDYSYLHTKENKKLIISEFKKRHLNSYQLTKFIFNKAIQYIANHFDLISYLFMIINHINSASLLSLYWPISIFCFALLEYPRPSKYFWTFSLKYAMVLIIMKFILQMDITLWILGIEDINSFNYIDNYKIGIKIFSQCFSSEFFNYIIWDCLVILSILLEQYILVIYGLWALTEREVEKLEDAYHRIAKANSIDQSHVKMEADKLLNKTREAYRSADKVVQESYYERLFTRIRNNKPGRDFYALYTIFMMLLIIYIIVFYSKMDQNKIFDLKDQIKIRQFSVGMIVVSFLHVFIAVLDRLINLKQNRYNLKFEYIFFNKTTGEKINYNEIIKKNPNTVNNYTKTYLQIEDANIPLISKYVLHLLVVIYSHLFIFWYLPIRGNYNLHNNFYCAKKLEEPSKTNCNDFHDNNYLIIFYILYLFYLIFSSLQIRYGLLQIRKKSLFKRGDDMVYSTSFKIFNSIPFLYELKLMIDWTVTPTALNLWKWIKFEAIYDRLYITKCNMKNENKRKIGQKISTFSKISMGGSGFLALLMIMLGPLLLFSSLNPTNRNNNVFSSQVELRLTFLIDGVYMNYTLFRNSESASIKKLSNKTDAIWRKLNLNNITQTKTFPLNQIQIVQMPNVSDTNWIISQPHIDAIKKNLKSYKETKIKVYISFYYAFDRELPSKYQNTFNNLLYNFTNDEKVLSLIDNLENCNSNSSLIRLKKFYKPTIHLTSDLIADPILDKEIPFLDVDLKLNCPGLYLSDTYSNTSIDYSRSYFSFAISPDQSLSIGNGIYFVTFSEMISETTSSYDVLGFYISSIFVIGKVIRSFISGEETRIILSEMPQPENIMTLCEGVKISRYRRDFRKEEYLYYVLIDLMRSPEIIKIITKSCIKRLREKEEFEKKNN